VQHRFMYVRPHAHITRKTTSSLMCHHLIAHLAPPMQ
jgi:hypothetical protein